MSVTQVTFNPAIWTAGFGTPGDPGSNGFNAFTVIPDQDGTTFWAFEYFGAGFARVNYNGTIVHQGAMFGNPGFTDFWYNREDGSSALAQDDQGHYFVMPNHGGGNQVLYKFSIGAGSAGNLLDGYCTNPTTLNLSGFAGNEGGTGVRQVEGWNQVIAPAADGNRYLAISNDGGSPAGVIINTTTMALVGNYSYAIGATYWASFMDKNGDFWFIVTKGDHRNDVALVHWHPQDGVTGSDLNVTVHDVSAATLGTGTNGINFGTYVASNHSVLLGNTDNAVNGGSDGQMVNIDLTTFTQNTFKANDGTFFFSGQFDTPQSTMMVGEQSCGIMMAGDVNPHVANSHLGGILNFIDPVALTLTQTLDATGAVLTGGFLAGGTFNDFHSGHTVYCPMGNVAYSHANNAAALTFEFVGSAVYIVPFTNPCITLPDPPAACVADPIGSCGGYLVTRQTDARSLLIQLSSAFFFDGLESDFKVKFVRRGAHASVMTIPEDDLGIAKDKGKLIEQLAQEQDLSQVVTILYSNPNLDYQQDKQEKRRNSNVVTTRNQTTIELPMNLQPTQARQIADKTLFLQWLERRPWAFNLFKAVYALLDPGDVIQFVYQSLTYEIRVLNTTIGQGFAIAIGGVDHEACAFQSVVPGAPPDGGFVPVQPPSGQTILFLLDVPYLEDTDAVADRQQSGFYWVETTPDDTGWPGAVIYESADNINFDSIGSTSNRTAYGVATGILGDPPADGLWTWDTVNTLNIVLTTGSLSSTTDAGVYLGNNPLLVGGEVIQFVNAVQEIDGSYTVSRLLRGRRNTEYAAYGHTMAGSGGSTTGEDVIVIKTGVQHTSFALTIVNSDRFYRGVTVGADPSLAASQEFTSTGADLKPASPVHITGSRDISNNLTIGWTRRTRYGGRGLVGPTPLNEDTEAYSIDIVSGGIVLRTISWAGTYDLDGNPTAVYSAANQTLDGLMPGDPVEVTIYQISAQVGRGFAADATI